MPNLRKLRVNLFPGLGLVLGIYFFTSLVYQDINTDSSQQRPTPTPTYELIFYLTPPPPSPTPTHIPDDTPPTTRIRLSGQKTKHGWYRSAVTITFLGVDNRVGVGGFFYRIDPVNEFMQVPEYTGSPGRHLPITITKEGIHNFEYYAVDQLGNFETPHTTPLKIDLTPPLITLPIKTSTDYTRCNTISYTVSDSTAGLTDVTATLDGQRIENEIDLLTVDLGSHTIAITATDQAGWVTNVTKSFTLTADIPGLICTKHRLFDRDEIYGSGTQRIVDSLDAKLDAAQHSINKGNVGTAITQLNTFINEVEAQRNKKITLLGADLMINDAQLIIELLERGEYQTTQPAERRVYLPMLVKRR